MSTNGPRRGAPKSCNAARPTMVQRARSSAGRAAGKVAYNTMYAGATQAATLYRSVIAPIFSWFFGLLRGVTSFQASVTGCLAVIALVVALTGLGALGMLGLARNLAYVKADIVRPLEFDYSQPIAVATANLREPPPTAGILSRFSKLVGYVLHSSDAHHADNHGKNGGPYGPYNERQPAPYDPAAAAYHSTNHKAAAERALVRRAALGVAGSPDRPLPVGQSVSVIVDLDLPADHNDLFQVTVELQGESGQRLARMSRPYMPPRTSAITQMIRLPFVLPWQLLGWNPTRHVKLQLIDKYVEQMSAVVQARVWLASRNASVGALPPPAVYSGNIHVKLRLGVGCWLLYWICPSWPTTVVLGAFAITTSVIAGVIALALMIVTVVLHRLSGSSRQAQPTTNLAGLHPAAVQQLRQLLLTGSFHGHDAVNGGRGGRQALTVKQEAARPMQRIDYQAAGEVHSDDGSEYDHDDHDMHGNAHDGYDEDMHDEHDGYDADSLASQAQHEDELEAEHHEDDEQAHDHEDERDVTPFRQHACVAGSRQAAAAQPKPSAVSANRQAQQQAVRGATKDATARAAREVEPAGAEAGDEEGQHEVGLQTPQTPPRDQSTDVASTRSKQRGTEADVRSSVQGNAQGRKKLAEVPVKGGAAEAGAVVGAQREGSLVDALARAAAAAEPETAQDVDDVAEASGGLFAALQSQVRQRPAARARQAGSS